MSLLAWDFLSLGEMPYADAGQGRLMLRSNERNTNTKIENFENLSNCCCFCCCNCETAADLQFSSKSCLEVAETDLEVAARQ